jgi:CMP-N,N'-diacetyllegionaminic acid synthase
MKPKVLAIVPARAGSKRLPNKNIKLLNGLPLVAHTFEAIKKSKYINATVATSDCPKVLEISSQYTRTFQLNRIPELASDTSSTVDVVLNAVDFAKEIGEFDIICLLQPTSPLRTAMDIDRAIELYINEKASGVVSMTKCEHSPLWATQLDGDNDFRHFTRSLTNKRSQDLKDFYRLNGAIYLIDKNILLNRKKIFLEENYYPYIMSEMHSIDIDTQVDFAFAEFLFENKYLNL